MIFMDRVFSPIVKATLGDNGLYLTLASGAKVEIADEYQQCCERRYATCDDDLTAIIGGVLMDVAVKNTVDIEGGHSDAHEGVFVDVVTSKGTITMCNHNEHNGYYGGFNVQLVFTTDSSVETYTNDNGNWRKKEDW